MQEFRKKLNWLLSSDNERIFARYLKGRGIEIGALNHPMTLSQDTKVLYVDCLDKGELRRHYPELKNVEIVDVDVVASVETLGSAFPANSLDFCIANHIIEHVKDPLGTLMQIHSVLRVGGILHLAVPDKRATFDRDRERTTLSHCVLDHEDANTLEKEKREYLHYQEWVATVPKYYSEDQRDYQGNLEKLWEDNYCIHLHVWIPDDWPEIIHYLNRNNCRFSLLDYSNVFCPEKRNEFVLILRKEDVPITPLQCILAEKGPMRWYIIRLLHRSLIRPLKYFRSIIRHLCGDNSARI